jgi:uncharacterized protein YndB with AHSA1/START domain
MSEAATIDAYGVLIEPATVRIQRMLPGPIERVWSYLTESELRGKWLATGDMELAPGAAFELVWRNDRLTGDAADRPEGMPDEHRMESRITQLEAPRLLAFEWGKTGGVSFELETRGTEVLLTVVHRRLPDRSTLLNVSAGWHAHLDLLAAKMADRKLSSFWLAWTRLKAEYDQRLPA